MNLSAKIAQVWYSLRDRLRLDAKFYAWAASVFLGISSFTGVAQAQLPDLGQCADLYQEHEDLAANAPPDAVPFVKRFHAAMQDKQQVTDLLNNPDTLRLAITKIGVVAA